METSENKFDLIINQNRDVLLKIKSLRSDFSTLQENQYKRADTTHEKIANLESSLNSLIDLLNSHLDKFEDI